MAVQMETVLHRLGSPVPAHETHCTESENWPTFDLPQDQACNDKVTGQAAAAAAADSAKPAKCNSAFEVSKGSNSDNNKNCSSKSFATAAAAGTPGRNYRAITIKPIEPPLITDNPPHSQPLACLRFRPVERQDRGCSCGSGGAAGPSDYRAGDAGPASWGPDRSRQRLR